MAAGDAGAQAKEDIRRWNCTRCAGNISDFQVVDVIYDKKWDLLAYVGYLPLLDAKTVVFRGTDSHDIGNWIQDLKAWRTDLAVPFPDAPEDVLVHAGFLNAYNNSALRANVTAAVSRLQSSKPEGPLHIIGHSLGAAFATLAALDLRYRMNLSRHDVAVVTFGSPRVGNYPFARYFVERIASRWRLTHNRDIVPSLPPNFLGFWHVPREVWEVEYWAGAAAPTPCCRPPLPPQPEAGAAAEPRSWPQQLLHWLWRQLRRAANAFHWPWPWPPEPGPGPQPKHWHRMLRVCDGTGEDPECHSSVCAWGGCTSIADHTSYLGLPLYHNNQEC